MTDERVILVSTFLQIGGIIISDCESSSVFLNLLKKKVL